MQRPGPEEYRAHGTQRSEDWRARRAGVLGEVRSAVGGDGSLTIEWTLDPVAWKGSG